MIVNDAILYPEMYYHIYNHGNASDNIFLNDDNYGYFLKRYTFFINPIVDNLAYCLLPNHFHFVIHIKNESEICKLHKVKYPGAGDLSGDLIYSFISQQFSNFFNAYSKAFNKMYHRNGKLFRLPFKRRFLDSQAYLLKAIHYVHANPVHHGFVKDMHDWTFSSIHAYETNRESYIKKTEGLQLFDGMEVFRWYHEQPVDIQYKIEIDF